MPLVTQPTYVGTIVQTLMQDLRISKDAAVDLVWEAVEKGEVIYGVDGVVRPVEVRR